MLKLLCWAGTIFITILVTGCGQGLDKKPDLSSIEKYNARISEDLKEVSKEKLAAYDWAVSDQNIESLKNNYSGKSYRQIAEAEIEKTISEGKATIAELEKLKPKFDPIIAELRKVSAEASNSTIKDEFMGTQFRFNARITNGSRFDFSSLTWKAELFLDGALTPVAEARLFSGYDDKGGLKAGQTSTEVMAPDTFMSKDWITLASKNAKERKVVLSLEDAKDFSNKSYLDGAPHAQLLKLKTGLVVAQLHKSSLAK
jgi:hypothetical protein